MLCLMQLRFYWVLGDIVSIENFREWCNLGCPTCNKKLKPEEQRFRCSNCNDTLAEGVYRYKVSICLMDNTGHTPFTLWDRECIDFFGKTSGTLMLELEKKAGDTTWFPEEIESLIDQKALFRIQIKKRSEENTYKGTFCKGIVSMIQTASVVALYVEDEKEQTVKEDTSPEKVGSSASIGEKIARKGKLVSTKKENRSPIDLSDTPLECTQREVEVELTDEIKHNLNDEFSTNGKVKKLKMKIKQEPGV
ncbi:unnamed protein product [Cuscuta epithymum]|uniref:Replication factor A C-terminal domain-containing protein n=1 Tax=Cuscuta epithymum TaxID=186058 RepID=A0AAV0EE39_9ASTE|nr:unnamed protein product [Cuscuta epithymum]